MLNDCGNFTNPLSSLVLESEMVESLVLSLISTALKFPTTLVEGKVPSAFLDQLLSVWVEARGKEGELDCILGRGKNI